MVTKIGMTDDVRDLYPCAKFPFNLISGFCSPRVRTRNDSTSYFFSGGERVLPLLYIQAPCTEFYTFGSWVLNRQIGFGDSKYGVTGDPLFTGHVNVTHSDFGPSAGRKKHVCCI